MVKRSYKLKPDKQDMRDKIYYSSTIKQISNLPKEADLRKYMSPIVDQGELGSCTANAIVSGLREYLENISKEPYKQLSRLYLYWWERFIENTVNDDSGAYIRDGMKVLKQLGCSFENDYPYDISKFTEEPTPRAVLNGVSYTIEEYRRVKDLNTLKIALAENLPVVTGIKVYSSFESDDVADTGIVPMPDITKEQLLGGHAILAVGYNDNKTQVIMRNSWGEDWGDKGYFYLPYKYFTDPNNYVTDMWTGK
ncbi:C1 family peptidase [Clostridium luticellarii]|jgi:C1A family cysteine protease|uniref:Papain family cysteine protease n=1 Tax=Clostridium luticellarii TaxID=1691940 RepID=A0A2T0BSQ1_9CLOT|nr:C1 family peptidase [Clostridium luticellarii]PRR86890.1 Papain family cysteine protease [Clostridium luticellarii]